MDYSLLWSRRHLAAADPSSLPMHAQDEATEGEDDSRMDLGAELLGEVSNVTIAGSRI